MHVLFVAAAHHEGDPARGTSYEYANFLPPLRRLASRVECFDAVAASRRVGVAAASRALVERVEATRPDWVFCVLFRDELDPAAVERVTRGGAATLNWFCDDHWRFERFSRHWAGRFAHAVTTDADSLPKYRRAGHDHVVLSQWACDPAVYRPVEGEPLYDVTFVGAAHGGRRRLVDAMRREGVDVRCFGPGWPAGPVTLGRMVEVFARSRISLGFTAASSPRPSLGTALHDRTRPAWMKTPGLWRFGERWRSLCCGAPPAQIKGRTFEAPACGGLLLTESAPHLERYFDLGREVCVFDSPRDAASQARALLADDARRRSIADAGRRRVLAEHTWDRRLSELFHAIGLGRSRPMKEAA